MSQSVACTTIENYLLGHWSNRYQAQSNPHSYSQVEVIWSAVTGGLHSKNFYRREGPNKPYRERFHKVKILSETEVIIQNYNLDWTRDGKCDMIFTFSNGSWFGKLQGNECIGLKGDRVVSELELHGTKMLNRDRGYDKDNNMVWGTEYFYKYTRIS